MRTWSHTLTEQTDTATGQFGNNVGDGWFFRDGLYRVTVDRSADKLGVLYECFKIENEVATLVDTATVPVSTSQAEWNMHTTARTAEDAMVNTITRYAGKVGYVGVQVAEDGQLTTVGYTEVGVIAGVASNRFATVEVSQANGVVAFHAAVNSSSTSQARWWVRATDGPTLAATGTDVTLPLGERPKPLWPTTNGYVLCQETIPYQSGIGFLTIRSATTGARIAQYQFSGVETGVDQSLGDTQLMPDGRFVSAITRFEDDYATGILTYLLMTVGADGALAAEQITYVDGFEDPDCYDLKPMGDRLVAMWTETWDYIAHLSIIEPDTGIREYEIPLPTGLDPTAPTNIEVVGDDHVWMEANDYPVITDWLYALTYSEELLTGEPTGARRRFWQ